MSSRKGGKVGVGTRREGIEKARSSSSRRQGVEKKVGSCSNTEVPVLKARNLSASLEQNREGQEESDLIIIGCHGEAYQPGLTASKYRRQWESDWSGRFGSFEDTTIVPPMRFTEEGPKLGAFPMDALQVFSVKLCETRGNLKFPLHVFGMVAVRDAIDHNRNIIFHRKREDCQTLTPEDPYLVLAGPTRAVMLTMSDPLIIEVELFVKGTTKSEDKYLSFLVAPISCGNRLDSCLLKHSYISKLSTLKFRLGHIISSVEATISVRITDGSWPSGYRGVFAAFALGCSPVFAGNVDDEKIVLFDSGVDKLPVTTDGMIKLSRRVVSVEMGGKLRLYVEVLARGNNAKRKMREFRSSEDGKSIHEFNMGFCKMEVTVNWSLISFYPAPRDSATGGKHEVGM